jgi:hypothetical protein
VTAHAAGESDDALQVCGQLLRRLASVPVCGAGQDVAARFARSVEAGRAGDPGLEYLLGAGGRAVSAEELLARVWDEEADPFTTTFKTTISRLRAKLGDPPLIENIRESGYCI